MEELIELPLAISIDTKIEDFITLSKGDKVTILEDYKAKPGTFTINHNGIIGKLPHLVFNMNLHTSNYYLDILNEFLIRPDYLYEMLTRVPNFKIADLFIAKNIIYEILIKLFTIEIRKANRTGQQTILFREITPGLVLSASLYEAESVEHYKLEFIKYIVDRVTDMRKEKIEFEDLVVNLTKLGLGYLLKTKIPNELIIIFKAINAAFEKENPHTSKTLVINHVLSFFFLRIISPVLTQTASIKPKASKILINKRSSIKSLKISDEDRPYISSKSIELHLSLSDIKEEKPKSLKTLFSPRKSPKEPERDSPKYKTLFKDPNNLQILLCLSKLYQALAMNNVPSQTSSIYQIFLKTEYLRSSLLKLAEGIFKTKHENPIITRSLVYDMSDFYMNFIEYLKNTDLEGSKILLMKLMKSYGISFDFDKIDKIENYIKRQICY